MTAVPLIVKRLSRRGSVLEVHCDKVGDAMSNAKHFREAGYTKVWIEDHEGRQVDEGELDDLGPK
jgi:hypothetical protein